jgi:hypothetical protein
VVGDTLAGGYEQNAGPGEDHNARRTMANVPRLIATIADLERRIEALERARAKKA